MRLLILAALTFSCSGAISSSWRPIVPAHTSTSILHQESGLYGLDSDGHQLLLHQEPDQDQCSLYKVSMSQQLYFEYIHYKTDLPDMKEFTLCMWTKFHNHTNDHPLFSYAVGDQPRGLLSWVANTPRSSYYMMNIDGHNLYRLNYPLRLNKWYHSCQSWNGRTGEWQIWVNDERVGRGFNNRLVGHVIKGGGIAISGQEQRQLGGGFLEGEGAPPGSGGMLGELTMVQLYSVALTAGKAHKDHKHHHVHHYEHDTTNNVPPSTTRAPVTGPPLPMHPFLTAGQINPPPKINPGAQLQIVQNGVTLRHPALPQEQPPQSLPPANPVALPSPFPNLQTYQPTRIILRPVHHDLSPLDGTVVPGATFRFAESPYDNFFKRSKYLIKRQNSDKEGHGDSLEREITKTLGKRHTDESVPVATDDKVTFIPAKSNEKKVEKRDSDKKKKRGLYQLSDGLVLNDGYTVSQGLDSDYFSGLASFGQQLTADHQSQVSQETKEDEREPAEAEVRLVMDVCDGCSPDPFEKALIMGWRSVPKKIYSGALYVPAAQVCKAF